MINAFISIRILIVNPGDVFAIVVMKSISHPSFLDVFPHSSMMKIVIKTLEFFSILYNQLDYLFVITEEKRCTKRDE